MDIVAYRRHPDEQLRMRSLLELVPRGRQSLLDIGSREGFLAKELSDRFKRIVALDLRKPDVQDPGIESVAGDLAALQFDDNSFDTVLCAEVLEHIPVQKLARACEELVRVARHEVVVGVPYRQDTRALKTTCSACGRINPPYGHVNVFDEERLRSLFSSARMLRTELVGSDHFITNPISSFLMSLAGNPSGSYEQDECCIFCGAEIRRPSNRTVLQRLCSLTGLIMIRFQKMLVPPHPKWIHAVLAVN